MSIAQQLRSIVQKALHDIDIIGASFVIEATDLAHGDYACNVAMTSARALGKNPRELAEQIAAKIQNEIIEKVEVAGPGFINITLSQEVFEKIIPKIDDAFGQSEIYKGKKILVEHSSPNLFKPFHIGHMMNNAIGESLTRLMQFSGAKVKAISYPSDISLGVAKAIFVILEKYGVNFIPITAIELGGSYTEGSQRYEKDESIHERVKEIANNLFKKKNTDELELFQKCKHFNMNYFETVVAQLGSKFDDYIYESEAGEIGKEIVLQHVGDVFQKGEEGAIIYIPDEAKKNLNTTVFINSEGNPTYGAKDIGLLDLKFKKYKPDLSITVTDHEQIPHFNVMFDAAGKINPDWQEKSAHIPHGRMSFKDQKISSRLGGVPLVTDMIALVSERAAALAKNKDNQEQIQNIAIAALKFAVLRVKPGQNISFDPDTSLSFEGDSGPYLQYTYARIQSLLEKAEVKPKYDSEEISDIERVIVHFPEVVELAIKEYAPQHMVTYLLNLAQTFNSYYANNKIVDSAHRLALARSVGYVLKTGMWLLGITAPDTM